MLDFSLHILKYPVNAIWHSIHKISPLSGGVLELWTHATASKFWRRINGSNLRLRRPFNRAFQPPWLAVTSMLSWRGLVHLLEFLMSLKPTHKFGTRHVACLVLKPTSFPFLTLIWRDSFKSLHHLPPSAPHHNRENSFARLCENSNAFLLDHY